MEKSTLNKVLTVSELTLLIKGSLESSFSQISVEGEISNFKAQSSGHLYFTIKDKEAQISCVLFKGNAKNLAKMPKVGDQVLLKGQLSVYPPRGGYQIIAQQLEFAGLGQLLLKLHELKNTLKNEGYFLLEKKKILPSFAKKILVITSPTGAVIQDIVNVLKRRHSGFELLLYPVKVQGQGAAEEISIAIEQCNRYMLGDVIIMGRGGGSMEDLWPFNERCVADAIYRSNIPIVSAVGHETDFTISDLVADLRAPTPSAAAEIVSKEKQQLLIGLQDIRQKMLKEISQKISLKKQKLLSLIKHPLFSSPLYLLATPNQKLDDLRYRLDQKIKAILQEKLLRLQSIKKQKEALNPKAQIKDLQNKFSHLQKRIDDAIYTQIRLKTEKLDPVSRQNQVIALVANQIKEKKHLLKTLVSHLSSIDPKNLLKKGYTILFSEKDDSIILSGKNISIDEKFYAHLSDGKIYGKIKKVELTNGKQ